MKKKFHLKNKHILIILMIVCVSLMMTTFASDFSVDPLRTGAGYVVVPFEKGIHTIGDWFLAIGSNFKDVEKLSEENDALQKQIEELTERNNQLILAQKDLERFQELYKIDEQYDQYPKVMAEVIAKDPGNWYSNFKINKGTKDGIEVNMNVLAAGGLAGIVTEVGPSWSVVKSIIDDDNNISGMTMADSKTTIVTGSLENMDNGKMRFTQMRDDEGSVAVGENIVTSHISDKYLKGILIGTISNIERDSNNLTSSGYLVPTVDFSNLQEVLVITQLKETGEEEKDAQ